MLEAIFEVFLVREGSNIVMFGTKPEFNDVTKSYYALSGAIVLRGRQRIMAKKLIGNEKIKHVSLSTITLCERHPNVKQ